VLSQFAGILAYVVYFASGRGRIRPHGVDLRVAHPRVWTRILRIGLPGGLNAFLFTVVYIFLSNALARFGNVPLAVLGVGNRLESINYLIAHGFSVAASTLVGQYLGAGRSGRAERAAWMSALYSALFTGTMGAIFIIFPERIFGIFTTDPDTLAEGVRFLRIIGLSQLWMGVDIAIYGAFVGAGSTVPPMAISSVISVLRVPLAYLAAFSMGGGVTGVWWMISITAIVRGALLAWWFRLGRWKEAKVW
jgi:putative MATE family efflux protein